MPRWKWLRPQLSFRRRSPRSSRFLRAASQAARRLRSFDRLEDSLRLPRTAANFYNAAFAAGGTLCSPGTSKRDRNEMPPQVTHKILIADDNQANCDLLEAYLADFECEVEFAYDGESTLKKVESFHPDLILLDVMMPKLSGFEVCKKLKQSAESRGVLIMMVTALNEQGDIERAVDAGTDEFVSKPVNRTELLKRVEVLLRLKSVSDENERLRRYIQEMERQRGPQPS